MLVTSTATTSDQAQEQVTTWILTKSLYLHHNIRHNTDLTFTTTPSSIATIRLLLTTCPSPNYSWWNLKKAKWEGFKHNIENTIVHIPKDINNIGRAMNRIMTSAKAKIPVPRWSQQSVDLLAENTTTKNPNTGKQFRRSLEGNLRATWINSVETKDYIKASEKAWNLIGRLSGGKTVDNKRKHRCVLSLQLDYQSFAETSWTTEYYQ